MDGWDIALWATAGYLAIAPLVRMMLVRRERLLVQFRAQMAEEKRRRKLQEKPDAGKRAA
jgi:hypothetical protein